jgi:hypothetical protein
MVGGGPFSRPVHSKERAFLMSAFDFHCFFCVSGVQRAKVPRKIVQRTDGRSEFPSERTMTNIPHPLKKRVFVNDTVTEGFDNSSGRYV